MVKRGSGSLGAATASVLALLFASHATLAGVNGSRITATNAAQLIPKGPDATAGIGDWHISNGTLCAVISDVEHEGEFSAKGGVLIDLGFCGRADDHYTTAQDLVDASRARPMDGQEISLSVSQTSASVVVKLATQGARQTTTYTLNADQPTELKVHKRIERSTEDEGDFSLYTPIHFNYHSLEPFVFASRDLTQSNGFKQEDFVSRGTSAMTVATRNADTIITISPPTADFGIAYGWHLRSAKRVNQDSSYAVPSFVLADDESNALLVLTDTFYIGDGSKLGWLQLPQIPFLSLDQGDALELEEVIFVGKRGDVASVTDQLLRNTHDVSAQINNLNSALHIDLADGTPLTHARPDENGRVAFKLPAGQYRARLIGSASRSLEHAFAVTDSDLDLGTLALPGAAVLNLPQGAAMRLVFEGLEGTATPNFIDTHTGSSVMEEDGEHFREASEQLFLAGLPGDVEAVELPPGKYRVYATRGPEYSLEQSIIELAQGDKKTLEITTPTRVLSTPGFIASDLHVHAGRSFDNTFSEQERVRTFVAEHGEVMVSSEHDMPVDFAPLIRSMGADHMITSIAAAEVTSLLGTELNPYTAGHSNFFPYQPQPLAYRRGMVANEDRRLRDIINDVRKLSPNVVVQLNHPRHSDSLSGAIPDNYKELIDAGNFFDHMGTAGHPYQASKPLNSYPNNVLIEKDKTTGLRDLDFDLIEVVNPGGADHEARLRATRRDWLSLVKQGERKVATANSDSHMSAQQVAVPRTMVQVQGDSVATFNEPEFLRALKAGAVYGTTGPMLELDLSGKTMGETFTGERGQLRLRISSADWISVAKAEIQINGETVADYDLVDQPSNELLVPISFDKDSFVTVEVRGPITPLYSAIYPGISPYAFSNPIYVDFDADGEWQAPGL